jgi:hypothetical protein
MSPTRPQARSVLVEAARIAARQPGPLHAFGERIPTRKGSQVAAVAVARKLACLAWQLLTKEEDYACNRRLETRCLHQPARSDHTVRKTGDTPPCTGLRSRRGRASARMAIPGRVAGAAGNWKTIVGRFAVNFYP